MMIQAIEQSPRTSSLAARYARSFGGIFLTGLCAGVSALILLVILGYVVVQGVHGLSLDFLTKVPVPVGETGGGVANGILGSVIVVGIAMVMALPVGVLTGICLALFARGWFAESVRFLSDVLSGLPSIAIGLFAYAVLVAPFKHFSALSASLAFAILMLPVLIRTTEQAVRSVPTTIREGALALGLSSYKATMHIVLPVARPAIVTGLLLAIARVTGETAPLLFTAFGSQYMQTNPTQPMAVLALQVFTYAISPYPAWHEQAWAGALLLILAVLLLNIGARFMLSRGPKVT